MDLDILRVLHMVHLDAFWKNLLGKGIDRIWYFLCSLLLVSVFRMISHKLADTWLIDLDHNYPIEQAGLNR